jgi:hypothetical protein
MHVSDCIVVQLVHHVYLMTYQKYQDTLYLVRLEKDMLEYEIDVLGEAHEDVIRYLTILNDLDKLDSFRARLVTWWHGSRIGNQPPWPKLS